MAMNDEMSEKWRKFLLPGAVSLAGAGAGLALSRTDKLRDALPSLDDLGLGDLGEDLRAMLGSATGKSTNESTLDSDELNDRMQARAERRKQRAGR
jgi:hypothetical protein